MSEAAAMNAVLESVSGGMAFVLMVVCIAHAFAYMRHGDRYDQAIAIFTLLLSMFLLIIAAL